LFGKGNPLPQSLYNKFIKNTMKKFIKKMIKDWLISRENSVPIYVGEDLVSIYLK